MSTRSLTRVFNEEGKELLCMYRHSDGYPTGHGDELAEFLANIVLVNGIGPIDAPEGKWIANGMDDVAAQLVAYFKNDSWAGGIYVKSTSMPNDAVPYVYEVHQETAPKDLPDLTPGTLRMTCSYRGREEMLYAGDPAKFSGDAAEKLHGDE